MSILGKMENRDIFLPFPLLGQFSVQTYTADLDNLYQPFDPGG